LTGDCIKHSYTKKEAPVNTRCEQFVKYIEFEDGFFTVF